VQKQERSSVEDQPEQLPTKDQRLFDFSGWRDEPDLTPEEEAAYLQEIEEATARRDKEGYRATIYLGGKNF